MSLPNTSSLRAKRSNLVVAFLLFFTHCGYTLSHRLVDSFRDVKGVFVPVFENKTDEVGAERIFTNALIRELASRREVILTSREEGGLELSGMISSIEYNPTAFTEPGFKGLQSYRRLPTEMGVRVTIILTLTDPKTHRVLWTKPISGFRRVDTPLGRTFDFEAPSSVGLTTQSIVESLYTDIARDIMRDAYDEMVELF